MGTSRGGLADFNESIAIDPGVADSFLGRAEIYRRRREWARAFDSTSKAIRLEPGDWRSRLFRGRLYAGEHTYDKALVDFEDAIRLKPEEPSVYAFRATVWLRTSRLDRGISDCDTAIRLWQGMSDRADEWTAHFYRGAGWYQKLEYRKAVADLERSIQLNPKAAVPRKMLAMLLASCPDPEVRDGRKAVDLAQKAYALSPDQDASYIEIIAMAYAAADDLDQAIKWQEISIRQTPPYSDKLPKLKEDLNVYTKKYLERSSFRPSAGSP